MFYICMGYLYYLDVFFEITITFFDDIINPVAIAIIITYIQGLALSLVSGDSPDVVFSPCVVFSSNDELLSFDVSPPDGLLLSSGLSSTSPDIVSSIFLS